MSSCSIVTTPSISLPSVKPVGKTGSADLEIVSDRPTSVVKPLAKRLWFAGENVPLEPGTVVIYNDLPNVIEEMAVCPVSSRYLYKLKQLVQEPKTSSVYCDKLKPFQRRPKLWDGRNIEDLRVGCLLDYKGEAPNSEHWYRSEVVERNLEVKTNQESFTIRCFGLDTFPFDQTVVLKNVIDHQKFAAFGSHMAVRDIPANKIFAALTPPLVENVNVLYKLPGDSLDTNGLPAWKVGRIVSVFESDGQVYFVRVFDSVAMNFHWLEYKVCYCCHEQHPNRRGVACYCGSTIHSFSTIVNQQLNQVDVNFKDSDFYFAVLWILFCVVVVFSFFILIRQFSRIDQSMDFLKQAALAMSRELADGFETKLSSVSSSFSEFKTEQEMLYSTSFLEFKTQQEASYSWILFALRKPLDDFLSQMKIVLFNAPWLWMVTLFCFGFTCSCIISDLLALCARFVRFLRS